MTTPPGPYDRPYDQTPPSGEYPQTPPPYPGSPGYPANPGYPAYPQPYGAQPYGQPYGQQPPPPGYPPYPGYPMPPQKKSNRTLWIVLGVVGGVLLLSCVACVGLVFWAGSQAANNPTFASTIAVTAFCGNEQQQRYTAAYDEFSTNLQSQMTRDQFVSASQAHDSSGGTVSDCTASPTGVVQQNDTSASFDVTVTRGTGATAATSNGTITLVKEGSSWKVDQIDPSLGLT